MPPLSNLGEIVIGFSFLRPSSRHSHFLLLIRPAQAQVNQAQRTLLCPDGPLHTLPFAALVSQTEPEVRYFIEDKPLHTIVSVTVYAETRKRAEEREAKGETKLLAFGDPIYTKKQALAAKGLSPVLMAQGRETEGKAEVQRNPEVASLQSMGWELTSLPESRKEVEAIATLFGESATTKLGPEATETAARQESHSATILHVACHGWLDEMGLSSGLVLSFYLFAEILERPGGSISKAPKPCPISF